ncbi:MAG: alpha-L-fucosidase, partial [Planctomycetota bacterium]|nr:alpha-L-fucosidase [Planctomycetota bacterium]
MLREQGHPEAGARVDRAWELNKGKRNEICMTMARQGWGYVKGAEHKDADELWACLAYAQAHNCALLANTGPLPDGSLAPEAVATLKAVGARLRREGWPAPNAEFKPTNRSG